MREITPLTRLKKEPFDTLLGYAPGNVAAYSSDYSTALVRDYPNRSAYRSYLNDIYMGYKWQCVEFARRWMYINNGFIFDDVAMAYDIFDLRTVRDLITNALLPFNAFTNGSKKNPACGSLIIWKAGGEFENTGHVAVVTEVTDSYIRIAEQNVEFTLWPEGCNFSRELQVKISHEGDYWISCSYGDAEILGWMTQTDDTTHAEPTVECNEDLFLIKSQHADKNIVVKNKSWLNIANHDEAAFVEMMGGHFLTEKVEDQTRYFLISDTAQHRLEQATNELHSLFMHATDYVLAHDELLAKFNFPDAILPKIKQSWDNRLNEIITSRFDFSLTPQGLKVYEYNCDSASCYMEAGKVQGKWAKHYGVNKGIDAGQDLFNDLVNAWKKSQAKDLVHILRDDDPEEKYHAFFMQEVLTAAKIRSKIVVDLNNFAWDSNGNIIDSEGEQVLWVWKTWAWETALDQIRSECEIDNLHASSALQGDSTKTIRLTDVLLQKQVMVFEPLWSLIPSNKAILPVLWSLFPNHPLLLHSAFELNDDLIASGYVIKPIVGRCGSNISLLDSEENYLERSGGNFSTQNSIYQQLFPLPLVGGYYTQVCTYTAAGIYSGSGVRVDKSMIINQASDCMPLRIINDITFENQEM